MKIIPNKSTIFWAVQTAAVALVAVGAAYRYQRTRELLTGDTGFFTGVSRLFFG